MNARQRGPCESIAALLLGSVVLTLACNSNVSQASPPTPTAQPEPPQAADPSVATPDSAPAARRPDVLLPIPARDHAPERPEAGWCAETAIQEALLYYGGFVPQRAINRAGAPSHPDLYWSDVPVAMKKLGLSYRRFANKSDGDNLDAFFDWIEDQLDAGRPVIAGVKIQPTEHPEWGLDHMVLLVGHDRGQALYINTTWGYRKRFTRTQLATSQQGIAFHNGRGRYFAYAIHGPRKLPTDSRVGRMEVTAETADELSAVVVATGLEVGRDYQFVRYRSARGKPAHSQQFTAERSEQRLPVSVDKRKTALFRYRPVSTR